MTEEQKIEEVYDIFLNVESEYLKKFGEHSLEYADYIDPRDYSIRGIKNSINLLRKAIKRNRPLPNIPPPKGAEFLY